MGAARTSRMIGSEQVQRWHAGRQAGRQVQVYFCVQLLCRFVWFSGAVSHHRETVFFIDFEFSGVSFFFFPFFFLAVMWQCPLDANFWTAEIDELKARVLLVARKGGGEVFLTFNESCCYLLVVGYEFSILPPLDWIKSVGGCLLYEEWMEGLFGNFSIKSRHPHNSIITDWDNNKRLGVYLHVL